MKKILILLLFLTLTITASACGANGSTSQNPSATPEPEPEPDPIYHPLTGLEVEAEVTGRMLVVSVDNNPDARPQSGVSQADLIYELPAEGGIPRIVMCFYGSPAEKIGPVRSARPYIVDVAREWGGLFVHCGWSPAAKEYLQSGVVDYANEIANEQYFWRDDSRDAPHNLYTSTDNLITCLEDKGWRTEQDIDFMSFYDEGEQATGEEADWVQVKYPYADNIYVYDTETNDYARFIGDDAYIDAETGTQVHVANIIMQRVTSTVLDSSGRLEIDMCAGGEAILFTGGHVIQGTWSRDDEDSRTMFYDTSGSEFVLNRGVTWIQMCDGRVTASWKDTTPATEDTAAEDSEDTD